MSEKVNKHDDGSQKRILIIGAVIVAVVAIMIIAILFETRKGTLKIENNSSYHLESISTEFVYDAEDAERMNKVEYGPIASKSSVKEKYDEIDLFALNANLEVRFKFEGMDEMFVDAGIFNDVLSGDVKIVFEDDGENITLKVKASNRGFGSTYIDCDEEFTINTAEGYVD